MRFKSSQLYVFKNSTFFSVPPLCLKNIACEITSLCRMCTLTMVEALRHMEWWCKSKTVWVSVSYI